MLLRHWFRTRTVLFSALYLPLAAIAACSTPLPQPSSDNPQPDLPSTVTDDDDDGGSDPVVNPPPPQPTIPPAGDEPEFEVQIAAAPGFCCNPLSMEFEAQHDSPQSAVVKYEWDFGDARYGSGQKVNHTYGRPGAYTVELMVKLADGKTHLAMLDLAVGVSDPMPPPDDNPPPDDDVPPPDDPADPDDDPDPDDPLATVHAHAGADQTVSAGDLVTLSGASSTTTGSDPLSFSWRQVAGPIVQLATPNSSSATFSAPTGYENATILTFELTAFVEGASSRDQVRVTVQPEEDDPGPTDPNLPSRQQIISWMAELPPLPKVHYSFPLHPTLLGDPSDPLLYQYVRLSRAVSLSSYALEWQIDTAVSVCDMINELDDGGLTASIAVNHSPWHNTFPADLPPTYTGPEEQAEIDLFRQKLTAVRSELAQANAAHGTHIAVTAILFDTERFYVKEPHEPGAAQWNAAINAKYAPFYDIARQLFPAATVEWYGRGMQESQAQSGWSPFPWFTFDEPADTTACSLYRVSELETMRETFRRTYDLALDLGLDQVTPWVALGAGYRRDPVNFQIWQQDWDYDPVYSLLLGREMNQWWYATLPDRYAPWDAARSVVFYPAPFDPRSPAWGKHFIAYVRGAAGRNDVP